MRPIAIVSACVILSAGSVHAQGTRLLRQPTVSGTQIAFAYAGDIWVASREGGGGGGGTPHGKPPTPAK
jgi:tricorn protease